MNIGVIFAGGVGKRMNSRVKPKQFMDIHGKPIIVHTLEIFDSHPDIDAVVVACLEEWIPYLQGLVEKYNLKKIKKIVPGGRNGQESIYHGLLAAAALENGGGQKNTDRSIVLIHDGVRPMIDQKTIDDNLRSVKEHGSAITSVTVTETVLIVADDNSILAVPNRQDTRLARAPQSFYLDEILNLHRQAITDGKHDFIDSCSMMHHYGRKLYLIDGPRENIKITTPDDFYTMRALLEARENAQMFGLESENR